MSVIDIEEIVPHTGDEAVCRCCKQPIFFEEGTLDRKKKVGWSDRITRGGNSLVCFNAISYRHEPVR